jgi:hypothetical protein
VCRRVGQSLAPFRELLSSRHTPKMRQVLRKLLGGNVFWFERLEDGYRIAGETLLGACLKTVARYVVPRKGHTAR